MTSSSLPAADMAISTALPQECLSRDRSAIPSPSEVWDHSSISRSTSSTSLSCSDGADKHTNRKKESPGPPLVDSLGVEFEFPDITMKQIYDAIPPHFFKRSAFRSLSYLLRDILCLVGTFYLFNRFVTSDFVPQKSIRTLLWALYTVIQGLFGTGLWVLAHECGHQGFSTSKLLNDTVGWICHSMLLVPYFSWKISHGKHHKATGNMARDMVFVPATREEYATRVGRLSHQLSELMEDTPIASAVVLFKQQVFGWPYYLFTNTTGHNRHELQSEGKGEDKQNGLFGGVNHFVPTSPLYERKDEHLVLLSDLGLLIAGMALYTLGHKFGWMNMLVWYFIPYMWVNNWLVAITYLQHTDPRLPHYHPTVWNFTRGAAATVDRDFGFIGRHIFHGITETHVLHHFVSSIPFYNAFGATEAIKTVLGKHYHSDTKGGVLGFLRALWQMSRMCQWVEPNEHAQGDQKHVYFYRNKNGLNLPPANVSAS